MPTLSRLYIKTSLIYLSASLLMNLAYTQPVIQAWPWLMGFRPAFLHLFTVGWLTQIIFGVGYWFFPRFSKEAPYGNTLFPRAAYPLLNLGIVLRLVAEPAFERTVHDLWKWGLVTSAVLQWLAVLLMSSYLWTRTTTRGKI